MTQIACVILAGPNRQTLIAERVLPSVLGQPFTEVLVVGDYRDGPDYRYLHVPPITGTTIDGLIKRETAAVATASDILVYLCDDHRLSPTFWDDLQTYLPEPWDLLAPSRYTIREGLHVPLNMGQKECYIGGHGIVVRRSALRILPWMAGLHRGDAARIWDVTHTHEAVRRGVRVAYAPEGVLGIEDIEPSARPWL